MTEEAKQGVRQPGVPARIRGQGLVPGILKAGDTFRYILDDGTTDYRLIPSGCIGVFHYEDKQISVIRDDCQAARRAIRAVSIVELSKELSNV